ncbi:hypothetical protein E0493_03830 [Roseomonas sp. M0104]|uniref:Uncharacterized protein n=1 Tax=Teichococcus coralli TaxID=2545983 RepID=A0A845B4A4_9PROT|nr:hypothetical protein [Pseudoroseomonas coralli]MXP62483.1 hypothetical protein [Pseudoroseomonas coralli]
MALLGARFLLLLDRLFSFRPCGGGKVLPFSAHRLQGFARLIAEVACGFPGLCLSFGRRRLKIRPRIA